MGDTVIVLVLWILIDCKTKLFIVPLVLFQEDTANKPPHHRVWAGWEGGRVGDTTTSAAGREGQGGEGALHPTTFRPALFSLIKAAAASQTASQSQAS